MYVTREDFVFLPFWVEAAMNRNSCSLTNVLDYSEIRKILSLEDMSGLLALQEIKDVTRDESESNRTLLNIWNESAEGTHKTELDSVVIPMSRSNELKQELLIRLSNDSNCYETVQSASQASTVTYYKVVDLGRVTSAMVVYKGFPDFVKDPENEYNVVVDQLKVFYVYLKSYQVSLLPVFRRYLTLLVKRVNRFSPVV